MVAVNIGGLFSGIGGLELGLESSGLGRVSWMAEASPARRAVLARHWPAAHVYKDVRDVDERAPTVDVLCGGFPCQDLSPASRGRGKGLDGPKSGLWAEYLRIIGDICPRVVLIENAPTWRQWVPVVRRQLWALGYASLPLRVSAEDVGAPHRRARCWVVAYADGGGQSAMRLDAEVARHRAASVVGRDWRTPSPGGLPVADGLPGGLDRCRMYGDAVVPAVSEFIGRLIAQSLQPAADSE